VAQGQNRYKNQGYIGLNQGNTTLPKVIQSVLALGLRTKCCRTKLPLLGQNLGNGSADITIDGDVKATRIRFNIFSRNQTYLGKIPRLNNIGPKGFTGEKYEVLLHWDNSSLLNIQGLPWRRKIRKWFRNLLTYRYNQLVKLAQRKRQLPDDYKRNRVTVWRPG
jgi:hypothetical protein